MRQGAWAIPLWHTQAVLGCWAVGWVDPPMIAMKHWENMGNLGKSWEKVGKLWFAMRLFWGYSSLFVEKPMWKPFQNMIYIPYMSAPHISSLTASWFFWVWGEAIYWFGLTEWCFARNIIPKFAFNLDSLLLLNSLFGDNLMMRVYCTLICI